MSAPVSDTAKPCRVQLSRKKGWRMPPNTVKVSRPGKWGNPFVVGSYDFATPQWAVKCFAEHQGKASGYGIPSTAEIQRELRGKNLACWCALAQPCHADVLLELANAAEQPTGP